MNLRSFRFSHLAAGLLVLPSLAQAHPGHDGHELTWDFSAGFIHPLLGLDHLLAMVAIGFWAARLGGLARWQLPAAFVLVMAVGAALAVRGISISWLEQGIAASVLVLGLLIVSARRMPVSIGIFLTAIFAVFHGLAHGSEIPANTAGWTFGAGFLIATAALHTLGLALGQVAEGRSAWLSRSASATLVITGSLLLVTG